MHRRANTVHVFSTDRPVTPCRVNDETRAAHTLDSTDLSLSLSLGFTYRRDVRAPLGLCPLWCTVRTVAVVERMDRNRGS